MIQWYVLQFMRLSVIMWPAFLGKKLDGRFKDELGNDFNTRIWGRVLSRMGPVVIKMCDNASLVLCVEITVNDVGFFVTFGR
ncbi:MAG: hypothetical protein FWH37_06410 [Candidatus Bathyarchaeota archaeon]|nr:hypothetical protein [Candidatus Termiticorpusculum sp.]